MPNHIRFSLGINHCKSKFEMNRIKKEVKTRNDLKLKKQTKKFDDRKGKGTEREREGDIH